MKVKKVKRAIIAAFAAVFAFVAPTFAANVAKVGNTQYATIDEAIANWTNGSTLTLLSNVTLSKTIELSSTEYHVLDLGTYTMTAASSKDAIQIVNNGRTSASFALDIKADAENPGGITATGKAVVRHSGSAKDRPITRFYNGVFNATYIVHHSGNNGANSPSFYFYGGVYNGTIYTNRSTNQFYGGTFNGSLQMSVDSSAYTLIAGGTFSMLSNMMGSSLNSGKFTIGSAKGVYDKEVYIDDNGNYVVAAAKPAEGIEAAVAKKPGTNDYFAYSKVATEGALNYTDAVVALKNNTSATVTIYADEIDMSGINFKGTIVVPEGNDITISNAPSTLKVQLADGTVLTPDANGTVVTKINVATLEALQAALASASSLPIVITETIVIPTGATVELDLNGKTVTVPATDTGRHIYALNNKGVLTIKDTKGTGSISARGIYNGYNGVSTDETVAGAKMILESGKFVGLDSNGGAAIFNCAELEITAGDFTGGVAAINNRAKGVATINGGTYHGGNNYVLQNNGGTMTINTASVDSGFGAVGCFGGTTTINDGTYLPTGAAGKTCHVVYVASGAKVTITGGAFKMNYPADAVPDSGSAVASYYSGTVEITGGMFTSHFDNVSPVELSAGATIKGGTYLVHSGAASNHNYVTNFVKEGYELKADGQVVAKPVAKIGDVEYTTLAAAAEAAQAGNEIVLLANVAEDVTVPADVIFNGNGKQVGAITAAGTITFKGITKATNFGVQYTGTTINIGAGACLEITGTGRLVVGHGCTFNIEGTIADGAAKTADKATLTPSLVMPGASFTGAGVTFNVKNAYITAPSSYCSSSKSASGTFDFNIENSIIETAGKLAFESQSTAATVNFELKNSVLNTGSHLVFGVAAGEVVIDNSNVNVGTSRQLENRSTMTIKNGSVVNGAVATSSNAINPGTIIVENATYAVTGQFSGAAEGSGTLIIKKGATVSVGSIVDKANIQIDATDMTADDEINLTANLSKFAGTVEVINNDKLEAKIVDGKIVLSAKPVAQIGEQTYTTLEAAFAAAVEGETIVLLQDATPALTSQRAITKAAVIDLNGKTLTLTEDDLYFGTTTFKNGNIVVDPSVNASTAVFWMFEGQTLTFNKVNLTATGVTGTYLIGINGGSNTAVNLIESEIVIDNDSIAGLSAVICDNGTDNNVVISKSTINIENIEGRFYLGGSKGDIEVTDSTVVLNGVKEGFYLRAGQSLDIAGNSTVNIVLNSTEGRHGINVTDLTATYTKADTATVKASVFEPPFVAKIGSAKYASLQAAVNAAQGMTGEVTILLVADTAEKVTVNEKDGLYLTIDGKNGDAKFNSTGNITIDPLSDENANRLITIQNIAFVNTADTAVDFISSVKTNHYPRIAVKNCSFTGNGKDTDVAVRAKTAYGMVIENCTATGLHSFLQNTAGKDLAITGVTVADSKGGFALGTVQGVTISGCNIDVDGYGIRMDAQYNNNAVLESNEITAFIPVVVRKATVDSNVTVSGTNTMIATNTDRLWFAIGSSEYETNGTMPTAPTGKVIVTLNDTNVSAVGVYGNYGVATIDGVKYVTLADALAAAKDGDTVALLWEDGNAPIAMNGAIYGKSVTITGSATVDWSKGFLFVGRGGEGNGTVIFDNANLASASDNASTGIHVSGREKNTDNKYDGTVVINNSTIELDYLIDKGVMTLDNSTLTVKNGFAVGGRPASETESGVDATATIGLSNGSKLVVNNHNGMGLGYEALGVMNIDDTSSFECTQSFLVTAKGTMNVNGGDLKVAGTLTNKGTVNVTDTDLVDMMVDGPVNAFGTVNISGTSKVAGILSAGYYGSPDKQVVVNITGNFESKNVLVGSAHESKLNINDATAYFGQLGAFGDVAINNSTITYGYAFIRNDFAATNSSLALTGGVNTYISGNAKVVLDNSQWEMGAYSNIGSYGGYMYGNADVALKNGSSITGTNLGVERSGENTVKLSVDGTSSMNVTKLSFAAGTEFTSAGNVTGAITATDGANISITGGTYSQDVSAWCADDFKCVANGNGTFGVVAKIYVVQVGDNKYETIAEAITAVADGGTITLLGNVMITEATRTHNSGNWYDGIYYVGDKSFTIDFAGFTVTHDGAVNDYLLNFKNDGAKENSITLKNGTIDAGTAAFCAICTSSASTQMITINTENINIVNNISNGSTVKIRGGAEFNANAGTKITGKNSYLGIECVASTVNIYDGAEIYMDGTGSYNGCLVGACGGGVVNVYGGYGKGVKGGFIAMTSGGTINVFGGEWIANNDGSVGDNSNFYVLTAQNNKYESGWAGASVINVTGGTFRGGMDAWVLNNIEGEKSELNIAGGNFNANPTAYLDEGYVVNEVNGTYTVAKAVAKIGADYYTNLVDAFKAATSGCTIEILEDIVFEGNWDDRQIATGMWSKFTVPVTVEGNGRTIKVIGSLSDPNGPFLFKFEADANVSSLTVDISEVSNARATAISSKADLTISNCKFIGNGQSSRGIRFGEGAGTNIGEVDVVITNSEFINFGRGISDNENGQNAKTVVITDNKITNASVNVSASESLVFQRNAVSGANSAVIITSYNDEIDSVIISDNTLADGATGRIQNAKNYDNVQSDFTVKAPVSVLKADGAVKYYNTVQAAVNAAQNGDTVVISAGEYAPINISNKNITIQGAVGDNGELLTVIKGGNPAITAHGFNGTIKDIKIVDAFKVMYAEPAGNVTVDNIYVTGATYGLHLVAYSTGLTWNIQNSYMDLAWANSFGVYGTGDAAIVIKGNEFASTNPYYPDYGAIPVNTFLPNITVEENVFGENTKIKFAADFADKSNISISKNYHADGVENAFADDSSAKVFIDSCYTGIDANGTLTGLVSCVAKIGDASYASLQSALNAAVAGKGNVTVDILADINMTGKAWTPVAVDSDSFVTVNGNNKIITGLSDMLFAKTWAGTSGLVINDLTISASQIVHNPEDAGSEEGVGAFVGFPEASKTVTLNNCHLVNSTVNGGHWTGGLVGYAAGYAGTDGPVFMTLTITNCSVTGSTITGKGSAGGIIGHGSGNAWTDVIIVDSTVSNNTIMSTGSSNNKAGSVMGTIGAAGQPTTVNGVTKTGGMSVSVTTTGNTVKSADTVITTIYGRQGTATGLLEIAGGSYEANPVEEGVAYASPIDGYKIAQNTDGTYGLKSALEGEGTEASPYIIATVEDLVYFRDYVNSGKTKFNAPGVWIALGADIDMAGINWVGIGSITQDHGFMGNFNGNGFKIQNLTISKPTLDSDGYAYAGFFSVTEGTDANNQNIIKNLTIENVTISTTGHIVSAAIAYPYYTIVDNVKVCGDINITGGNYTAGALAYTRRCVNASNVSVVGNDGSTITGAQTVGGVISDIQMNGGLTAVYSNFSAENLTITGTKQVGGISGIIATQALDGATVKNVTINCADRAGQVAGSFGGTCTISNIVVENVTGADAIIGATYKDGAAIQAKLGDTFYATFAEAFAAAKSGDTLSLLADIEASEVILIDKNLTINGNEHKVTSSATRVFRVTTGDTEVTLNDVNMVSTAVRVGTNDIRGISIDIVNNVKLTLNNCSVDFTDASANDWAYAVNVTGGSNHTLTVNGGTYEGANVINVRGENNTVVVKNAMLNSTYPNNDMYYGAGIWVEQEKGSSVEATGNTFNGSNALAFNLGTGTSLTASNNTDNTSVGAAFAVAKIGDKGYMTLASAIAVVKNGETIVLAKDCNENATISQKAGVSFAIDGDNKTYTGKFTVKGRNNDAAEETLVIKNVKFETSVDSHVFIDATVNKVQNLTVEACAFKNNDASTVQGLKIKTAGNITVKNCNADGLYYLVNNTSGGRNLIIDNCVVNGFYGARIHNNIDAIVKNSIFNTEVHAIVLDAGNSAVTTIENCNITVTRADRYAVFYNAPSNGRTLVVNGDNNTFTVNASKWNNAVKSGDYKIVLNDADLAAPDMAAKIGNVYYNSLSYAIEDAQDNDEVKLIREINIADETADLLAGKYKTFFRIAGKNVTVDFNGNYIRGNNDGEADDMLVGVFSAEQDGHLVLKGEGGIDLTATDTVYCLLTAFDSTASLTVESGTYKLDKASSCLIYADGSEIVWVKGGNFELGNVGTGNNGSPWIFNATGNNTKHVHVSGGTFNADVMHQYWEFEVQAPHDMMLACKSNGNGAWTILPAVACVKEPSSSSQGYIKEVGYATFAEAIAAAERTGGEMTILAGTYTENLNVNKGVTVVGETDENGNNLVNFNGKLNVTADGATIKNINVQNTGTACYVGAKNVLIEGCSLVGSNGLYQSYTTGTVTFKDSVINGATYGVHFDGKAGGNIVIDNCEITGWTSFAGTITNVAISDTEFKNGNYNQLRFYQNAQLTNVKFNENMTVDFGTDDVDASFTGCMVVDANADGIVKPLTDVIYKGDIVDMGVDVTIDGVPMYVDAKIGDIFYLTLADAIAAAQAEETITLVRDIDLGGAKITVPAGKNITIDLNGKTVGGTHGAEYAMIHVQNGADMTIDDTIGGGKITCAAGGNNVGAVIWVEGSLVQNAGSIELTGAWALGFNVDLRPNAWGTAHTVPASFVMNGGKIVSTDTAVRVASNSSDSYSELGVNFTMNGGEIESAWDAIFVQHLYAGDLNINIEEGSISGANSALRIYGDAGSDVDMLIKNGAFTGPIKIAEAYVGTDAIAISGGVFSVPVEESYCAEGYIPVAYADGTYGVKQGVFTVRLNGAGFETLQAALDAAQAGDNEIVLLGDSDETVIVSQTEGVNITIDGDGYTYTGTINVHGNSRFSNETLTITNFVFFTTEAEHDFIWSDSQDAPARYPHNVTVSNSDFMAMGNGKNSAVGIRLRQGKNINVVDCSATGLHSLIQAKSCSGAGVNVDGVTMMNCKNGMSFGTSNFSVANSLIYTTGADSYGIRADGSGAYMATVEDCVIDAYIPVLVRNIADDGFTLTVAGDNHFMADNGLMENGESYLVVFSKGDVDAEKSPVAPETTFNLVIEDGSLDPSKVYPGFEALVGTKYFGQLEDAVAAAQDGDTVTVLKNVGTDAAIQVAKKVTIDLNGKTIAATENDKVGDGVFCVVAGGDLTINDSVGTGVINGVGDNNYNIAIWANGGKVTINGGNYTNVGATDKTDPNAHFDLIYAKNGGEVIINGGTFECETPAFTLNSHDTYKGVITVNGGTFVGFDPRNNAAETAGTTFMAPGKFTMSNGNNYVVVEPGSYMLNEAYCAKGTVADIDAAIAGAVTLTTIDGVITAKATFTFKVTAVDTINPEKSSYELTGGKLRPGKTVAVKYIDLATGTESWDKPEADTVTFKLVIK